MVIFFFENIRRLGRALIAVVAGAAINPKFFVYIWVVVLAGLAVVALVSYLQYQRFLFHIEGGALRISKGVLVRDEIIIPFDRIQTVNLHRNVVQQVLNLTGVRVDTAGSGKKELQIHALKLEDARALQQALQKHLSEDSGQVVDEASGETSEAPPKEREVLVRLGLMRLFIVGLTQNHIRNGLVAIGFVFGTFSQLDEWIERAFGTISEDTISQAKTFGFWLILIVVVVFLVSSVLFSLIQVILRYFNLEARLDDTAFEVEAGLLKRNQHTIPLHKVQFLEWKGNFLRDIPGFETLRIFQGRSQENIQNNLNVSIPAVFSEQTERIMETLYRGDAQGQYERIGIHPFARIFRFLVSCLLLLPVAAALAFTKSWLIIVPGLVLFAAVLWMWTGRYHRSIHVESNGKIFKYSRGWAFKRRTVLSLYKLQSIEINQNFLHRRRGVAHVNLYTAGGKRNIRYLPVEDARRLADFILYRVEAHEGSWM